MMNRKVWLRLLISLAGGAAVAALIWLAGPILRIGDAHPLEDAQTRILAIAAFATLLLALAAVRIYRRRRGAERIASGMSVDDSDAPVLAERMKRALADLRGLRGGRATYLYDLPWYVLIGPPGSGKTTALINSGLEFPLAKGIAPGAVAGVGGTRYCDWWFTEDAVLIDTAGRYTTQDSDAKADQKSWLAFLDLLKRNRPRQPINGVLVAISLEDLLTLSPEEIAAHANAIRSRLVELHARLGVDFPVYAVFTKADLVIGFMEYFGALDEAGRRQVWGTTFQTMDKTKAMLAEVPGEFDALIEHLNKGVSRRLADERDPASRVLLFGFPAQMAALRDQVSAFLTKIFDRSHYKIHAALRGFYFTSGTQQGTPIDQLLGALAKGFGAEAVGTPAYSGQGKSFFLTDLMKKVVIGEAGWVTTGRGNRLLKIGAIAALLIVTPQLIFAWWVSYAKNTDKIAETEEAAGKYHQVVAGLGDQSIVSDRDFGKALPALHALRYLPGGFAEHAATEDEAWGLGLSQSARLRSAAETAYASGLERLLRPRLVYRLEEQLEAHADDPDYLFGALQAYLMLGGLKTVDRDFLIGWMQRDWSENLYPGTKNSEGRKELEHHLVAMLDLETGHGPVVSLNGPLVERTQAKLARVNVVDRAYRLLEDRAKASLRSDWVAAKSSGPGALIVFSDAIESVKVPYFYTRAGYEQAFMDGLPAVTKEMAQQRWVLGSAGETPGLTAQYDGLDRSLADLYAKDFIAAWRDAIGKLEFRQLTAERPTYPLLAAASSPASPLPRLLESIRDETNLSAVEPGAGAAARDESPPPSPLAGTSGETPAAMIEAGLAPYQRLVEGPPGQRPVDRLVTQLNDIRLDLTKLAANGSAAGALTERLSGAVVKLDEDAASLPQPFARMMTKAASDISREIGETGVAQASNVLRDTVTLTCEEKIASRYPFAPKAEREVAFEDFARMFGPSGSIDRFTRAFVLPAADTKGSQWKWRKDTALASRLGPGTLANLQLAAEIRAAFFAGEAQEPGFTLKVSPPPVAAATMEIDSTSITRKGRDAGTTAVKWPGSDEPHRAAIILAAAKGKGRPAVLERTGAWSLFRLVDAARKADSSSATFSVGGRALRYRFASDSALQPLDLSRLRSFRCPDGA
jgi:type VI secretion system protein ImpL